MKNFHKQIHLEYLGSCWDKNHFFQTFLCYSLVCLFVVYYTKMEKKKNTCIFPRFSMWSYCLLCLLYEEHLYLFLFGKYSQRFFFCVEKKKKYFQLLASLLHIHIYSKGQTRMEQYLEKIDVEWAFEVKMQSAVRYIDYHNTKPWVVYSTINNVV